SKKDVIQTVTGADRKFMRSEELAKAFEAPADPEDITGEIPEEDIEVPVTPQDAFAKFKQEAEAWIKNIGWAPPTVAEWLKNNFRVTRLEDLKPDQWMSCCSKLADMVALKG
ncbi:MAG: hypothetical protein MUO99_05120, partial [Dehalococcoidales bacterium]|nr:hypothetical protein [Dehalococcoidales bacterium]